MRNHVSNRVSSAYRKYQRFSLVYLLILIFLSGNVADSLAQQVATDTVVVDTSSTEAASKNTFLDLFQGKPGKAALYGLLIPSGGQIYNRKWWKVPIALAIDGFTIYNMVQAKRDLDFYQDQYITLLNENGSSSEINRARLYRNRAQRNYDYGRVYFVLGHILTVVDAYIDRHLMDFDISDDLSFQPVRIDQGVPGLGVTYSF